MAHELNHLYEDISISCKGIIFMGTPHRGTDFASWGTLLSRLANALTLSSTMRTDLFKDLETGSKTLSTISRQFIQRGSLIQIVSFYERNGTGSLNALVRFYSSSKLGEIGSRRELTLQY